MKEKVKHIILKLHPKRASATFNTFLKDESIGGKLILVAALLSMIIVNSSFADEFAAFWSTQLSIGIGSWTMSMDLRHWLNEGLMAFFFLLVGIEIKREIVRGELKEFKNALLPIGAAVGGMIVPALIYLAFNGQADTSHGWGIPIATDIAFAVAVLALLGNRVPTALKIFLLTLAIADDIGAIAIIALVYAEIINYGYLFASVAIVMSVFLLRNWLKNKLFIVVLFGLVLWLTTHLSGIHASIVGAVMGLLAPIAENENRASVAERVEKLFLPVTTFIILPVFAFANAGFVITSQGLNNHQSVFWGILLGLVFGKVIGITLAAWLLTKFGFAKLPSSVGWRHIIGIGFIAGIGFTVSIFITELAFSGNAQLIDTSKFAIFVASALSAVIGATVLLNTKRPRKTRD